MIDDIGVNMSKEPDISTQLLEFYDEFTAFNSDCAFLCEAFASMVVTNANLDSSTVNGLISHAQWLKQRSNSLEKQLKQIQSS